MWSSFIQLVHQSVIEVDGDSATARVYISEYGIRPDGAGQTMRGVYEDKLVRTDAGWRFTVRHFRYLHQDQEPIPGLTARDGQLRLPRADTVQARP